MTSPRAATMTVAVLSCGHERDVTRRSPEFVPLPGDDQVCHVCEEKRVQRAERAGRAPGRPCAFLRRVRSIEVRPAGTPLNN